MMNPLDDESNPDGALLNIVTRQIAHSYVIGLLASSREINFEEVLAYELAAYPPSIEMEK